MHVRHEHHACCFCYAGRCLTWTFTLALASKDGTRYVNACMCAWDTLHAVEGQLRASVCQPRVPCKGVTVALCLCLPAPCSVFPLTTGQQSRAHQKDS